MTTTPVCVLDECDGASKAELRLAYRDDSRMSPASRYTTPDLELWQQQNPLVPSLQAPALAAFNPHIGKPLSAILRLERAAGEDRRALRQP